MPMGLQAKKDEVLAVHAVANDALSLVIADSRGVNMPAITTLRHEAHQSKVVLRVVKNALAKRAFKDTDFECVVDSLTGPCLFAFSMEEPGSAARLLKSFGASEATFKVKILSFGGEMWGGEQIDKLANLPTRDQALTMLASLTKAPVQRLAFALNDSIVRLARVLQAVAKTKS